MGVPMILAIILLVWLPLLIFALLNQIGEVQIPDRVTMTVSIEGYPVGVLPLPVTETISSPYTK